MSHASDLEHFLEPARHDAQEQHDDNDIGHEGGHHHHGVVLARKIAQDGTRERNGLEGQYDAQRIAGNGDDGADDAATIAVVKTVRYDDQTDNINGITQYCGYNCSQN